MISGEEREIIQRAGAIALQLGVITKTAAPLLEELAGLLERISDRPATVPPLELVDPLVQPVDLNSQALHPVDNVG